MIASGSDLSIAIVGLGFTLVAISLFIHRKRNPPRW